ncbi:MAG: hypothetical protein ACJA1N_001446 [Saprospiraceae bacterium]|jgi:hypothetical protein
MKKLPLGRQDFSEIINEDLLYVDKTDRVYNIIEQGKLYFLSRPRRFGKSLLISTFRHLFEGKKELFKDLYLGKSTDYAFKKYPVLQFNFADFGHKVENLEAELVNKIQLYANEFNVKIGTTSLSAQFIALVQGIAEKGKPVVLLIDEYDKPIIDFFTEYDKATANQKILRDFFSPLKGLDSKGYLHFLFITGVSKFSKVSLFSDLNNLTDLSIDNPLSNDLLGITHDELENNFQDYIQQVSQILGVSAEQLLIHIKEWYNGYSYNGIIKLCNPFSLLTFFQAQHFGNYWFVTGTPTFLVEKIRSEGLNPKELEDLVVNEEFFHKFSLKHLDIRGLLFQTGYLTLKRIQRRIYGSRYYLDYPNLEVKRALTHNLVEAFTYKKTSVVSIALVKMEQGFEEGNIEKFIEQLKIIIADIAHHLHPPKNKKNDENALFQMWEGYFHTIVYLVTSYMKMYVQSEVTKHKGRLDLVAETDDFIYLMEFKLDGTSENAIEQIKTREYAATYKNSEKIVFLVGVNFSKEDRNVEGWEAEQWK